MDFLAIWLLFVALMFGAIAFVLSDSHDRRDHAFDRAQRECVQAGRGNADAVDIEGQDRIAFVCSKDGGLRRMSY